MSDTRSDAAIRTSGSLRQAELRLIPYAADGFHRLMAFETRGEQPTNVAWNGSDVTVGILSGDHVGVGTLLSSLRRCCATFAGEILIADGAAGEEAVSQWRAEFPEAHAIRCIEGKADGNPAAAQAVLFEAATRPWILLIEDGLQFEANPFEALSACVSSLGCHFVNLVPPESTVVDTPCEERATAQHIRVAVRGGQTFVHGEAVSIEVPHTATQTGWLSTLLNSRAALLGRSSLAYVGGYDAALTPELADLDLSMRLFRAGMKVGNVGCRVVQWQSSKAAGVRATDTAQNEEAVARFENTHAFSVGPASEDDHVSTSVTKRFDVGDGSRPRVALIIDRENWAFSNIARQVRRKLSDQFDFVTIPVAVIDNMFQLLLMTRHCDLIHFFWRELPQIIVSDWMRDTVERRGGDLDDFMREHVHAKALSVSIYDHLHLEPQALEERRPIYADFIDGYYVGSNRLRDIYKQVPGYPAPLAVLPDGVDLKLFYPQRLERLDEVGERALVVGWVGNSSWNSEFEDFKGVHTILKPAIEQLQAEGLPITTHFVDRATGGHVPHEQMVHHYAQIDVYICTSKIEGTPNPVLESMACGVPVITTDVGIVPEAFGPQQKEYILRERSVECLKAAIRQLMARPAQLRELSGENLEQIKAWDWPLKAAGFGDFFRTIMQRRDARCARNGDSACHIGHSG